LFSFIGGTVYTLILKPMKRYSSNWSVLFSCAFKSEQIIQDTYTDCLIITVYDLLFLNLSGNILIHSFKQFIRKKKTQGNYFPFCRFSSFLSFRQIENKLKTDTYYKHHIDFQETFILKPQPKLFINEKQCLSI
jgi:hypothetical protein